MPFEYTRPVKTFQIPNSKILAMLTISATVLCCATRESHAQQGSFITIRTLASVQQAQDEMRLQEKLGNIRSPRNVVTAGNKAPVTITKTAAAAQRKRSDVRLLSVYGPHGRLNAEALDAAGEVRKLDVRDQMGGWVVREIREEGVLLHRDGKGRADGQPVFIAVGESLDEGKSPW